MLKKPLVKKTIKKQTLREQVLDGHVKHVNSKLIKVAMLALITLSTYCLVRYFFQEGTSYVVSALFVIIEMPLLIQIVTLWFEREDVKKDQNVLMLQTMLSSSEPENVNDYLLSEVSDVSEEECYVEYNNNKLYYEDDCSAEEMRSALNNAYPELRAIDYVIEGNKVVIIDDLDILMEDQVHLENKGRTKVLKKYKKKRSIMCSKKFNKGNRAQKRRVPVEYDDEDDEGNYEVNNYEVNNYEVNNYEVNNYEGGRLL